MSNLKQAFQAHREQAEKPDAPTVHDTFVDMKNLSADETRFLNVRVPKTLHKQIKERALALDVTVQDFVRSAVVAALAHDDENPS